MDIAVTARRQVLDRNTCEITGFSPEIRDINNDQLPCHCRIKQGKNKMRASKASIHGFYIVGEIEATELINECGSEPVIGKQGVATPCDYNLGIQHAGILTG